MKRFLTLCTLALMVAACKKVDTGNDDFVLVTGVKLDQTEVTLVKGDDLTLHATVSPTNASVKDVNWTSSDGSIASVDKAGKVTAKAIGKATITATTKSGGFSDKCTVTVVKETIHVTGVTIEPENVKLKVGGTQQLTAKLQPADATNHKVSWRSSDDGVATVSESGLVKAVARGDATITVKTDDGGKEASIPVKVVQSYTKLTITSPNTSDSHYDNSTQKYTYYVGESFQLVVEGEPSDADDEVEYFYTSYASSYDIDDNGKVTVSKKASGCKITARSKTDDSVSAVFTFDIQSPATSIALSPDSSFSGVEISTSAQRNTECIGVGATQVYKISVTPATTSQVVSIKSKSGDASFSLSDNKLTVTVPSTATASNLSSVNISKVVLKGAGEYVQEFSFKITKLDPYQVKVGDVITRDGTIGDGGYRDNGIFENPVYTVKNVNCIIAHLGTEHLTEDPLWDQYKPSPGLTVLGKEVHGIAIPVNITKLYRSSQTGGEVYYSDSGNDNYIEDSGNLPDWVKTEARKSLLRSNSLKHSAFMNTCCHVHTNAGRGNSYEILPFNYFVEDATQKPSKDAGVADSWWNKGYVFKNSYSALDNGFNASSHSTECGLLGPWVLPTIADFNSVFTFFSSSSTGVGDFSDKEYTNSNQVKFKVQVLLHSLSAYGPSYLTKSYNDTPMWLANETGQNKFVQGIIANDGASFQIRKSVAKNTRGYVFPIRYF